MEWISVQDKLPKDLQLVLCFGDFISNFHKDEKGYAIKKEYWPAIYYSQGYWSPHLRPLDAKIMQVTHWMTLPEAPK